VVTPASVAVPLEVEHGAARAAAAAQVFPVGAAEQGQGLVRDLAEQKLQC
jgi:hypothetical protein